MLQRIPFLRDFSRGGEARQIHWEECCWPHRWRSDHKCWFFFPPPLTKVKSALVRETALEYQCRAVHGECCMYLSCVNWALIIFCIHFICSHFDVSHVLSLCLPQNQFAALNVPKKDNSQIEGPSIANSYGFKISMQNLQDAKALHEVSCTCYSLSSAESFFYF